MGGLLKALAMQGGRSTAAEDSVDATHVLAMLPCNQLESLRLRFFHPAHRALELLCAQQSLTSLSLEESPEAFTVEVVQALPHLRRLACHSYVVIDVLESAPDTLRLPDGLLAALAPLAHLATLELSTPEPGPHDQQLQHVTALSQLRSLKCSLDSLLPGLMHGLAQLQQISSLELAYYDVERTALQPLTAMSRLEVLVSGTQLGAVSDRQNLPPRARCDPLACPPTAPQVVRDSGLSLAGVRVLAHDEDDLMEERPPLLVPPLATFPALQRYNLLGHLEVGGAVAGAVAGAA